MTEKNSIGLGMTLFGALLLIQLAFHFIFDDMLSATAPFIIENSTWILITGFVILFVGMYYAFWNADNDYLEEENMNE